MWATVYICNTCVVASSIIIPTATTTSTTTSTTTTSPIYGCPDSTWTVINRANYYWCAYVIPDPYLSYEYEGECAKIHANAVVWGVQDQGELQEILTLVRSVQVISINRVCLGALRRPECYAVVGVDATCTALTSFYWTDGYTTGTDGFNWAPGYPKNINGASDPFTYLFVDTQTDQMEDVHSNYYLETGLCGMLPIQLN